jgi:ATP-binding cassette subfamily C protein
VARLTRQVEIVRDSFAGLVLVIRSFAVTVVSGLLSLEPVIAALVVPLFLLGLAAARVRTSLRADEDLASTAGSVFAGVRDITAGGAEDFASDLVGEPIETHAAAERALVRVAALRILCFALGGWLPLLILVASGPWLVDRGVTTGTLLGGLTYVLIGLQPALGTVLAALATAACDTSSRSAASSIARLLQTSPRPPPYRAAIHLQMEQVTFAYGAGGRASRRGRA